MSKNLVREYNEDLEINEIDTDNYTAAAIRERVIVELEKNGITDYSNLDLGWDIGDGVVLVYLENRMIYGIFNYETNKFEEIYER